MRLTGNCGIPAHWPFQKGKYGTKLAGIAQLLSLLSGIGRKRYTTGNKNNICIQGGPKTHFDRAKTTGMPPPLAVSMISATLSSSPPFIPTASTLGATISRRTCIRGRGSRLDSCRRRRGGAYAAVAKAIPQLALLFRACFGAIWLGFQLCTRNDKRSGSLDASQELGGSHTTARCKTSLMGNMNAHFTFFGCAANNYHGMCGRNTNTFVRGLGVCRLLPVTQRQRHFFRRDRTPMQISVIPLAMLAEQTSHLFGPHATHYFSKSED